MSAGIAATSPALQITRARLAPVSRSSTSQLDLVAQLHEPLDAVVAVDHGQDVLLGRRAVQASLHADTTDGFHVTSEREM